ncbi:MAG TPA: isoprenylcysteine carboxylmethyltransferase family protein [Bauldia sp.]|nr:isoprenylcysteine carboxylmethyltransferase family protein [Bauldia sp.]
MNAFLGWTLAALWIGWFAYWMVASSGTKPTARAESWQSRLAYSLPLWAATILLIDRNLGFLSGRILPHSFGIAVFGVLVTAAGLAFAVWARLHLGTNWSAEVTVKHDHELVQSGPYAWARHPIYTGLSLAFLGTSIAVGEWRAVLALALAVGSFWYKLGIEERVMRETFGVAYDDYARRVKALVPFLV